MESTITLQATQNQSVKISLAQRFDNWITKVSNKLFDKNYVSPFKY